jgi:hypothetical protein
MKKKYTDARRGAITRDRSHVFNKRKAFQINFAAPVPDDVKKRANEIFKRLLPRLGKYKTDQKQRDWQPMFWALERAAGLAEGCVRFPRNKNHADYQSIRVQLMDAAYAEGLVLEVLSPKGSPKMSRYIPYEIKPVERTCFVELRDRETKELLLFDEADPVAADVQRRLARVNGVNANWKITIKPYDRRSDEFEERKRIHPVHYAVFTDDFEHHGRMYTGPDGHQSFGKIDRRSINFDTWHSVELDYSGMHSRLLYHRDKIPFSADPYKLWGDQTTEAMRLLAKHLINTAINAKSRKAAIDACNQDMNPKTEKGQWKSGKTGEDARHIYQATRDTGLKFSAIYDLALKRHARIAKYFGSDAGMKFLMRIDSRLALDILYHFASRGIPCLGVHDSFIVPEHYKEELRRCMIEFYLEETGFEPVVK